MSFVFEECIIPKVWCGNGKVPKGNTYAHTGTPTECLKIGFGAGMHNERSKHLSKDSLQQIKYVGEIYEVKFKKEGIKTIANLLKFSKDKAKTILQKMLIKVFTRSANGGLDKRAYNSTLVYLYQHGIATGNIPKCSKI